MGEKYKKLDHEVFKNNFKDRSYYNEGVEKLNLSSWEDFHKVVKIFNGNMDYIWRGQRCYPEQIITKNKEDWKLRSTFDRYYKNGKIKSDEILDNFKEKLRDLPKDLPNTGNIDFSKKYEVCAIGQHYGLLTQLLDWTKDSYIAAFFAFYKKKDENQTKDRVVYALNRVVKRLMVKEKDPKTKKLLKRERNIEFDFDMSHFALEHNQRFKKQKGAFTKTRKGEDVKSVVKKFWKREKKNYLTKVILAEILIPDEFRCECLSQLKSIKKITYGALFPDYAGAVEICKIELDLDNLKCRPS